MPDRRPSVGDPHDDHCAKLKTFSSAAIQPPAEPQALNKMPLLPAEIIFAICRCFTVGPHNPAKGFHVSLSARDNIRTLRQLSLTCRGIHEIVTPILYGSIYFRGPKFDRDRPIRTDRQDPGAENLVYFLRTILENARLRQHVKDLACLMDLRDTFDFNEIMDTPDKDYDILPTIRDCKDVGTKDLLDMANSCIRGNFGPQFGFEAALGTTSYRPIASMSHQLLTLIICLLPNLTSISLRIGSRRPHYPQLPDLYHFMVNGRPGQSDSNMTQHSHLRRLGTLQVQCEAEDTALFPHEPEVSLLDMMPLLQIASNLTQIRGYGCVSSWSKLPDTVTSFEGWGSVSWKPLVIHSLSNVPILHLKTVVIRLASTSLDFDLSGLFEVLAGVTPALEHLEVFLYPGVRIIVPEEWFPTYALSALSRLRHLCFDTRCFSEDHWDYSTWCDPEDGSDLPSNIETLRIVDSEPRRNPGGIIDWLDVTTTLCPLAGPGNVMKLKKVEYLHMPLLTDTSINGGGRDFSKLEDKAKQTLSLQGVQFHLILVNAEGA